LRKQGQLVGLLHRAGSAAWLLGCAGQRLLDPGDQRPQVKITVDDRGYTPAERCQSDLAIQDVLEDLGEPLNRPLRLHAVNAVDQPLGNAAVFRNNRDTAPGGRFEWRTAKRLAPPGREREDVVLPKPAG